MMGRFLSRYQYRIIVFLHDLAWVPASIVLAYVLRFNLGPVPLENLTGLYWMLAVATPVFAICYWYFGLFRGTWRFVSVPDLARLVKTVGVGVVTTGLLVFLLQRFEGIPRSVFIGFPLILVQGLAIPRLLFRWSSERRIPKMGSSRQKVLIVGAGPAGEAMVRNISRSLRYFPAALVDPDPAMKGKEIHGIRVLGNIESIPSIVRKTGVGMVILAIPEIKHAALNRTLELCSDLGIPAHTMPRSDASGKPVVDENLLRPVNLEDLLNRDPVVLDLEGMAHSIGSKRVLVTGGGGSIGSELCRQIADLKPELLIVVDHSEFNLFEIETDLDRLHPDLNVQSVLCDVKDRAWIEDVFTRHAPQIVFHAAAYKHVPLLESNIAQAVRNNVFGTMAVAQTADRHGCEKFVLISTDKAVNPTNVMGASKRVAELFCQNLNRRSGTSFITTRFGNVLGSAGSVVPIFEAQIARGGPVTVTHPEIRRFFMTIPEAVRLILQAAIDGKGGEIFVLEMGEDVPIKNLAEQMIRLAGLKPHEDISIVYTGLRPGEKLFEEIFHPTEGLIGTKNPKLLLAAFREVDWERLLEDLDVLDQRAAQNDTAGVLGQLKKVVPEFNTSLTPAAPEPQADAKTRIKLVT